MSRMTLTRIVMALVAGAHLLPVDHAFSDEPTASLGQSSDEWQQEREQLVTEACKLRKAGKLTESIRLLEKISAGDRDRLGWLNYETENSLLLLAQVSLEQLDCSSSRSAIWKLLDIAEKRRLANRQALGYGAADPTTEQAAHFRRAALRDVDFVENLYAKELASDAAGLTSDVLEPVRNGEFLTTTVSLRYWARDVQHRMLDKAGQLSVAGKYGDAAALGRKLRLLEQALVDSHAESEANQALMELGAIEIERLKPWATSLCASGRFREAFGLSAAALEIAIPLADRLAEVQAERQQVRTMRLFRDHLDICCTAGLRGNISPERLYDFVLEWKGRVFSRRRRQNLDRLELADSSKAISQVFAEYEDTLKRMAGYRRALDDPVERSAARRKVEELGQEQERLERELALIIGRTEKAEREEVAVQNRGERTSIDGAMRTAREPSQGVVTPMFSEVEINALPGEIVEAARRIQKGRITTRGVQAAIPRTTVLVDFLVYARIDKGGRASERRLLAFVLRSDRPIELVDLGELGPIDNAVSRWCKETADRTDSRSSNSVIFSRVWRPLENYVRDADTVLLSPDGPLTFLPLGGIRDPSSGSYLIERYAFSTVPAPQLLPEIVRTRRGNAPSMLVVWGRLKYAKEEVAAIEDTWRRRFHSQPKILSPETPEKPTETRVRELAPQFTCLHFATHGELKSQGPEGSQDSDVNTELGLWRHELASSITLAEANEQSTADIDDGILTGLEVSTLDLSKVDLVVLSACESGLGDMIQGEGVLGINRAFAAAGARSTVTSLWRVPSRETAQLMSRFYDNLWQKRMSNAQSLREAQIWMLKNDRSAGPSVEAGPVSDPDRPPINPAIATKADSSAHPYFWAGFVVSGDWR